MAVLQQGTPEAKNAWFMQQFVRMNKPMRELLLKDLKNPYEAGYGQIDERLVQVLEGFINDTPPAEEPLRRAYDAMKQMELSIQAAAADK